jgi:hypothetical protein
MTSAELSNWLRGVSNEVGRTKSDFPINGVHGCPMPFFGDVLGARVVTVGVNPSNTEFVEARGWEQPLKVAKWEERLLNYFDWPGVPAHGWFETWSVCLEFLGLDYASGAVAHIDVSPRPTTPMLGKNTDKVEFREMVERDVKWFFELVENLPNVQLLLVAGPIPRADGTKQQLADFIRERCQYHQSELIAGNPLPRLVAIGNKQGIPVFICPYEPPLDGLYAMVRQVYRNRELLRETIA